MRERRRASPCCMKTRRVTYSRVAATGGGGRVLTAYRLRAAAAEAGAGAKTLKICLMYDETLAKLMGRHPTIKAQLIPAKRGQLTVFEVPKVCGRSGGSSKI